MTTSSHKNAKLASVDARLEETGRSRLPIPSHKVPPFNSNKIRRLPIPIDTRLPVSTRTRSPTRTPSFTSITKTFRLRPIPAPITISPPTDFRHVNGRRGSTPEPSSAFDTDTESDRMSLDDPSLSMLSNLDNRVSFAGIPGRDSSFRFSGVSGVSEISGLSSIAGQFGFVDDRARSVVPELKDVKRVQSQDSILVRYQDGESSSGEGTLNDEKSDRGGDRTFVSNTCLEPSTDSSGENILPPQIQPVLPAAGLSRVSGSGNAKQRHSSPDPGKTIERDGLRAHPVAAGIRRRIPRSYSAPAPDLADRKLVTVTPSDLQTEGLNETESKTYNSSRPYLLSKGERSTLVEKAANPKEDSQRRSEEEVADEPVATTRKSRNLRLDTAVTNTTLVDEPTKPSLRFEKPGSGDISPEGPHVQDSHTSRTPLQKGYPHESNSVLNGLPSLPSSACLTLSLAGHPQSSKTFTFQIRDSSSGRFFDDKHLFEQIRTRYRADMLGFWRRFFSARALRGAILYSGQEYYDSISDGFYTDGNIEADGRLGATECFDAVDFVRHLKNPNCGIRKKKWVAWLKTKQGTPGQSKRQSRLSDLATLGAQNMAPTSPIFDGMTPLPNCQCSTSRKRNANTWNGLYYETDHSRNEDLLPTSMIDQCRRLPSLATQFENNNPEVTTVATAAPIMHDLSTSTSKSNPTTTNSGSPKRASVITPFTHNIHQHLRSQYHNYYQARHFHSRSLQIQEPNLPGGHKRAASSASIAPFSPILPPNSLSTTSATTVISRRHIPTIDITHAFSLPRILAAVAVVVLCTISIAVFWICFGTSRRGDAGGSSSRGGAGERIVEGLLMGIVALGLGSLGLGAWIGGSWVSL